MSISMLSGNSDFCGDFSDMVRDDARWRVVVKELPRLELRNGERGEDYIDV
jgi:hypothetical protein